VAVVIATIIATVFNLPIQYVSIPESIFDSLNVPKLAEVALFATPSFWGTMIGFAVIASAETLLCATAVDRMHDGERTNYDRELFAQGIGNALCGLCGALPMTGVIVRSSANVEAGAKTKYSAIMHGAWLLLFVVFLPFLISWIPTSVLAAILVYTGYKLVNPAMIRKLWKAGKSEVFIYAATVIAIVSTDLLTGVLIGFGIALLKLLYTFLHLEIIKKIDTKKGRVDVALRGTASFIKLPRIADELDSIDGNMEVHFHLGALAYADHATLELFDEWRSRRSGKVFMELDEYHARARGKMALPEVEITASSPQRS
jgi:MFS superfamily sulfate permease-like transporter